MMEIKTGGQVVARWCQLSCHLESYGFTIIGM